MYDVPSTNVWTRPYSSRKDLGARSGEDLVAEGVDDHTHHQLAAPRHPDAYRLRWSRGVLVTRCVGHASVCV